ncbi:UNVERIFIED_CONTAM: hypothetical protein ODX46_01500, partial [Salmonella enterica subsp. enterica serovar Enteritidis]
HYLYPSKALTHERVFDPMLREGAGRPATVSRPCGLTPGKSIISMLQDIENSRNDNKTRFSFIVAFC